MNINIYINQILNLLSVRILAKGRRIMMLTSFISKINIYNYVIYLYTCTHTHTLFFLLETVQISSSHLTSQSNTSKITAVTGKIGFCLCVCVCVFKMPFLLERYTELPVWISSHRKPVSPICLMPWSVKPEKGHNSLQSCERVFASFWFLIFCICHTHIFQIIK